jgi:DNA polymerase I-like protein with 3'-5' exonuclease and polymerase domains
MQVVYGLVYGIGAKSLGEQLGVGEDEAFKFMENFKVFLTFFYLPF